MSQTVGVWRKRDPEVLDRREGNIIGKERELKIPSRYCRIDAEVFKNNIRIRSVFLPEEMREIGVRSFCNNTTLREVQAPGVEVVGKEAFYNCTRLKEVLFSGAVSRIGKRAFAQCIRMEQMVFSPDSVCQEIEDEMFSGCENLCQVELPRNVRRIGKKAFYKCRSLEKIVFPPGLQEIGDSAFLKCSQLEYVRLPESVRKIEKWVFHGCTRLKILEISGEPEEIGEGIINRSTKIRCRRGGKTEAYCREAGFEVEYFPEKEKKKTEG